jgi:hypothetical protein
MRVRLKKINWTTKRLADGTIKTYWYAWRGGPALEGEPGAPEFIASYNAAVAQDCARLAVGATLSSLLDYFQSTSEFKNDISARTQGDYIKQIKVIEAEFGDFPLSALGKKETRGIFKEWRARFVGGA